MKKYNFKHIMPVVFSFLVILYACDKSYLEVPAAGALSQDVLANKIGVEALLVGAYSLLMDKVVLQVPTMVLGLLLQVTGYTVLLRVVTLTKDLIQVTKT